MRIIIPVLYVFAGLVGCSFAISSAVLIAWIITGRSDQSDGMTAFGDLVGVVMLLASFLIHGFCAILFVVSAESVRVLAHKKLPT